MEALATTAGERTENHGVGEPGAMQKTMLWAHVRGVDLFVFLYAINQRKTGATEVDRVGAAAGDKISMALMEGQEMNGSGGLGAA